MENQNNSVLALNAQAVDALRESAKWSFFLAIMGFIGIAFMIIAALVMGSAFSAMGNATGFMGSFGPMMSGLYILMAVLYFFPVYYLMKYASDTKSSLLHNDPELLSNALTYLKSHHKFLGVTTIVIMSLYVLLIVGVIIFAASSAL